MRYAGVMTAQEFCDSLEEALRAENTGIELWLSHDEYQEAKAEGEPFPDFLARALKRARSII